MRHFLYKAVLALAVTALALAGCRHNDPTGGNAYIVGKWTFADFRMPNLDPSNQLAAGMVQALIKTKLASLTFDFKNDGTFDVDSPEKLGLKEKRQKYSVSPDNKTLSFWNTDGSKSNFAILKLDKDTLSFTKDSAGPSGAMALIFTHPKAVKDSKGNDNAGRSDTNKVSVSKSNDKDGKLQDMGKK